MGGKKVAQTLRDFAPTCRELGIGIVAYSPLGRGFFSSGAKFVETLAKDDFRKFLPRFQLENLEHNNTTVERVSEMASRKKCTPSRLALAWVHHQGDDVCPIPGTTMVENFNQNIAALSVNNSDYELKGSWSVLVLFSHKGKTHSSFTIEELRFRQMQPATTWTQLNLTPTLLTLFLHVAIYNLLPKKKIEKKCI